MKKAKTATTKQSYSEHFVYVLSCTISSWFCLRWLERPKINGFFFFFFFVSEVAFYFFGLFDVCMKQCRPTVNWNFILLIYSFKKKKKEEIMPQRCYVAYTNLKCIYSLSPLKTMFANPW